MALYKLKPAMKSAIWGGRKLIESYGKTFDGENLAETWELSAHPDGSCIIDSGEYSGLSFPEYLDQVGKDVLGSNCSKFDDFPILIKLIDAKDNLSVQVHPDDEYARKHENQFGKTEMWYVVEAEPGAKLCYGCKDEISKDSFREHAISGELDDVLNFVPVKKGDVFFIESGTIHAIGGGIVIAEIQQNSNVTYRVYDYGRKDANGNTRELHLDKALDVSNLCPPKMDYDFGEHIGECNCFVTDLLYTHGGNSYSGFADNSSFVCVLVVDGAGIVSCNNEGFICGKGDCFFIEAGSGDFSLSDNMTVILVRIP